MSVLIASIAALLLAAPAVPDPAVPGAREAAAAAQRLPGELDRPQALADLFRLWEQRDDQTDLRPLDAQLRAIARSPRARPDVRALAGELRAQLALARGDFAAHRTLTAALAPLRAFSVLGPFENDGRSGYARAEAPERDGFDPAARVHGKDRDVSWRAVPAELSRSGFVDLSSLLYPRQEVSFYAATVLRAAAPRAAIFHLGASGAAKVWVNGRLVHEDPSVHPARFDQAVFAAALRAGDNFVLVKVAHGDGKPGFRLRVADRNDVPDTALARAARIPDGRAPAFAPAPVEVAAPTPALPAVHTALAELKSAAAARPSDPRSQEDLALYDDAVRPDDEGDRFALHAMERAQDAAPRDPEVALRLAGYETRDANRRRAALDAALEAHPADPALLCGLGALRLDRGDGWTALELARKARTAAPRSLQPLLLEARALDAVGLSARAALLRLEAPRIAPLLAAAHRAAGSTLHHLGRNDEAVAELRRALALRFDDLEARGELAAILADRGEPEVASRLLAEAVALDPAATWPRLRAAELLSQAGRAAEADAAHAQLARLAPDDPDVQEQLGRHRLRKGDEAGALRAFDGSLALRPQNPALRDLVRSVHPEEPYATPYLYDARALAKLAPLKGEDVEVLADLSVTKVFQNGLSSRTHQLLVRANSLRGVELARAQSVQYSPDRQVVRVERARIYRPDGSVLESKSEGDRSLSEPWYGLFYDVRARVVAFPQLEPGDVVEIVTRLDDSGSNFFADYFGDFAFLQGMAVRRVSDYVLLGPPGRTFYATATPLPSLKAQESKLPDGGTVHRWTAREVPRIAPEPGMPGSSELFAWVHVSTYKTWNDVGRFYWGLVKDQLRVTGSVRAAAEEAVKGIPAKDELARIRAVYDYVVSRTRYVGLEFGINSFKPYPVETILERRFGDCKDKASLMHAMLEALGIDSRLTLLRMRHLGGIRAEPASLAVFNHAILYVPRYQLYLDGTAEFHGSGELPADDRGADVLVVEPDGDSHFRRIPEARPLDNSDRTRIAAELRPDGSARVEWSGEASGSWTAELRRTFEPVDGRRARAEEQLGRSAFPNATVSSVEVSDPHELEKPFSSRIVAQAPQFAQPVGRALRFSPFGRRQSFVEAYAALSRRSLPQRGPLPQTASMEVEVRLPAGWSPVLPDDAKETTPYGAFSVHYAREEGKVRASLEVSFPGNGLLPSDYGAFRAFLARLDAALQQRVEATPPAPTASLERTAR